MLNSADWETIRCVQNNNPNTSRRDVIWEVSSDWLVGMLIFNLVLVPNSSEHLEETETWKWGYYKTMGKQDGGWTMVEKQQEFSDVKGCEVDVFRDTALRYLGECFIYCNEIVMKNSRPRVPCTWSFAHRCCFQIGERLARYSIAQFLSV